MTAAPYPVRRRETGPGPPLVRECLELALVDGEIHSLQVTQHKSELVKLAPPVAELDGYRRALAKTAGLEDPPDDRVRQRIRDLVRPLQEALQRAVPARTRDRMAAEGLSRVRKLVAIELTLADAALEAYPWELIADPGTLCAGAADVTVWRRVPPP